MEGLESRLHHQRKRHLITYSKICYGVQIMHSRGNHWIVANNNENEVVVYDSLYDSVDAETLKKFKVD
jgi:hypothetical protein